MSLSLVLTLTLALFMYVVGVGLELGVRVGLRGHRRRLGVYGVCGRGVGMDVRRPRRGRM